MQRFLPLTTFGILLFSAAASGQPQVVSTGGIHVESADGAYEFDLGGRLMWDMDSFDGVLNPAGAGDRRFSSQLRRSRLELSGKLPGDFDWVFDIDYVDDTNEASIHTAGLRYTGWSVTDVFVGRTKEPFGLEELTSSKAISTMRRSLISEATDADSQPNYGVRFDGGIGPVRWSAGAFNPSGNPTKPDGGDRIAFTGRIFGTPVMDDHHVLHLGAAYTDRNLDQAQNLTGFQLRVAETGDKITPASFLARQDRQMALEALYINGPFSLQGEYFHRDLNAPGSGPDADVDAGYLLATWTVTGESRGYKPAAGVPDMVKPAGPRGAVELVARIERASYDLPAAPNPGARVYLVGANWYPNRNVKLMLDVSRADTDDLVPAAGDDDGLAVSARIQVAF